ncbi:MAG: phosphoribosyl-ATP diphosphatase [Methanomicrobiales archaeon]|jgi:phosphoribosyl-ATP pyrophosphohydrolase|nr:phosphoribosyl-ATP diphosphatase [Methanomicrobiales archaeon]
MDAGIIVEVWDTINQRMEERPKGSYVVSILNHRKGMDKALEKVGEEATEFILAAKNGVSERTVEEAADLLFHILLALRASGEDLGDVLEELSKRHN